ncbi:MAG: hypothetical protein ACJA0E_001466 [Bermanella sp.]|jgi:hypothetical protein
MRFIIGFFLTMSLVFQVQAMQVNGLYDARVVVINQSAEARKQGAKAGLMDVLYKVSGFPVPADNAVVNRAFSLADQYLSQFSFTRVGEEEWDDNIPPGSSYLNMKFEGKSIQNIIRQAQLPRWGANRPNVMVWVIVDDGSRQILSDASDHKAISMLETASKKRGVPLVLPVYDLEDSFKLPIEQLWGLFKDSIVKASERYAAESILAGRVYRLDNDRWGGNFRFYFKQQEYEYEFESNSLEALLLSGVSAAGNVLADTFALKPSVVKKGSLTISVRNVKELEDYGNLLAYLQKLAVTKQVSLIKVTDQVVLLELSLNGTLEQFKQSISLNNKLIELSAPEPEPSSVFNLNKPVLDASVTYFTWR